MEVEKSCMYRKLLSQIAMGGKAQYPKTHPKPTISKISARCLGPKHSITIIDIRFT